MAYAGNIECLSQLLSYFMIRKTNGKKRFASSITLEAWMKWLVKVQNNILRWK